MAGNDGQPVVIKKVVKKGHGGHHGGAWKVAYADFTTASTRISVEEIKRAAGSNREGAG